MTPEIGGLILAAVFALLALNAYRDNQRSDASWERMRRDLTPVMNPPQPAYAPFNPSSYLFSTATTWGIVGGTDSGHTHQIGWLPK